VDKELFSSLRQDQGLDINFKPAYETIHLQHSAEGQPEPNLAGRSSGTHSGRRIPVSCGQLRDAKARPT